jgi:hypothetical protein
MRGEKMDTATLIVTALTAGAAAGMKNTASAAVKDAYDGLKTLVTKRLAARPDGELILARHQESPQTWEVPLTAELTEAGAVDDVELVAAAQALMSLIDQDGTQAGKYAVKIQGSQGVQVGDHNIQHNSFGIGPLTRPRASRQVTITRRLTNSSRTTSTIAEYHPGLQSSLHT